MSTVWTERKAGSVTSTGVSDDDDGVVIVDPEFSPDWVKLPEETPGNLGGVIAKVTKSMWFPIGINPEYKPGSDASPWTDKKTRWHLVDPESGWDELYPLALAEVPGAGWYVIDLGATRTLMMLDWD